MGDHQARFLENDMDERIQRISLRAYELWEQLGRPKGHDLEDWLQAEREINDEMGSGHANGDGANEGEGSRSAARDYNTRTEKFVGSGRVEAKAREAARAMDGPEAGALKAAEATGKRHSHGEDPEVKR